MVRLPFLPPTDQRRIEVSEYEAGKDSFNVIDHPYCHLYPARVFVMALHCS